MPVFTPSLRLVFLLCFAVSSVASAQSPDVLSVERDHKRVVPRFALSAEPIAPLWGRYDLHIEYALTPMHAVFLQTGWHYLRGEHVMHKRLGYHLWLFRDGLQGPFIGPLAELNIPVQPKRHVFGGVGAEAGYQYAWGRLLLTLGLGVLAHWQKRTGSDHQQPQWRFLWRAGFGYAWI